MLIIKNVIFFHKKLFIIRIYNIKEKQHEKEVVSTEKETYKT